jgi:phage baseplate assembly protein W
MPYKNFTITPPNAFDKHSIQTDHFYKGFSSVNNSDQNSSLYDFDLIKQDILNNFNTRRGERLMRPNYGSIIWDLLMEPLTSDIRQQLTDNITAICTADPRATPIQIDLTEYAQGYLLELTLKLVNTDQSSTLKLDFNQEAGLTVLSNTVGTINYVSG